MEYSVDDVARRLHCCVVKVRFTLGSVIRVESIVALRGCPSLVSIDISGANIWSDGPKIVAIAENCPLLRELDLSFIMESCRGYPLLILAQRLHWLETLKLCSWTELCDDALGLLITGCPTLRSIFTSHCYSLSEAPLLRLRHNGGEFCHDHRCVLC